MGIQHHILLRVAFKGSAYHGYQTQENARTIQDVLSEALFQVVGKDIVPYTSSRTDAGVHALDLPVAFSTSRGLSIRGIVLGTNRLLPADIRIIKGARFEEAIKPRKQKKEKTYDYLYWNTAIASPLLNEFSWHIPKPMDLARAEFALEALVGTHDFSAFRARGCGAQHARRTIHSVTLTRHPQCEALIVLRVKGNAFVRHQIRILGGTIAEICLGKRAPRDMSKLLQSSKRSEAGKTAPAHGLTLVKVELSLPKSLESWPPKNMDSPGLFPVLFDPESNQ